MIAAIYVRKSNEQNEVSEDQKSLARQIDHATQYAARKGWHVDPSCVFTDDAISGAEFARRPGFLRLMNALKPRPPFQVLVMSEESRLGRESIETAYALKQLVQAGVRVFFYLGDRERTLDSPTDKIMLSLTAFADELEREKARQRTYDAMLRKARAGHVTGGRVFGYANVVITGPDGKRSHVERCIVDDEADVVRRIFTLCANGFGLTRITKTLNEDGVAAPRPQQGRPRAWVNSTVREVLLRTLYRGEITWNQSRKRDSWGLPNRTERSSEAWVRVDAQQLRIVSDEMWQAAHDRLAERQHKYATQGVARQKHDRDSPYLLSGFARCAICGGGMGAHSRQHGGQRVFFYGCTSFWKRGATVCANNLVARMDVLNEEVIASLRDDVFRAPIIEEAIRLALAELAPARQDDRRRELETDRAAVVQECARLAEAIGRGGPLDALLARMAERQARQGALDGELRALQAVRPLVDLASLETRLRTKLEDWRGLLRRNVQDGREVLRSLLVGPLRFTPVNDGKRKGYTFEGTIAIDRLIAGVVDLPTSVASPTRLNQRGAVGGWLRRAA